MTVVGSSKMAVFDDMEPERKVTVYDKGPVMHPQTARIQHPHRRHPPSPRSARASRCGSSARLPGGGRAPASAARRRRTRAWPWSRCWRRCRRSLEQGGETITLEVARHDVDAAEAPGLILALGRGDRRGRRLRRRRDRPRGHGDRRRLRDRRRRGAGQAADARRPAPPSTATAARRCGWARAAAVSAGAVLSAGRQLRRRLRGRRPGHGARAVHDRRRGRRSAAVCASRTTPPIGDRHQDPDERLHHGRLHARGARVHRALRGHHQRQLHGPHRGAGTTSSGRDHPPRRPRRRRRRRCCRGWRSARRRSWAPERWCCATCRHGHAGGRIAGAGAARGARRGAAREPVAQARVSLVQGECKRPLSADVVGVPRRCFAPFPQPPSLAFLPAFF